MKRLKRKGEVLSLNNKKRLSQKLSSQKKPISQKSKLATSICLKASDKLYLTSIIPISIARSTAMASSSDIYSRAPNSSGILLLTDFPRGKDRSWIRYQPLLLFGIRLSSENIKRETGWLIIFISLL